VLQQATQARFQKSNTLPPAVGSLPR
jgi:hypothetical protein